ncbi:MAG TPA: pyridoxal-phosphate dependent enzyme [Actinomycetaceae bacterium]|nr:pyridoxal-phosphate dependent enzyme [Actinomycetaceae bacterium]
MAAMSFACTRCGTPEPADTRAAACRRCGGLFRLVHRVPAWDPRLIDRAEWSLWRYRAFLPQLGDAWSAITMGEGMTPIVPFDEDVLLKLDYLMPTLSFKDRGTAVLMSHLASIGSDGVVQDSSGNAGASVAAYAARAGIACDIFVPEGTSPAKIATIRAHGAACHIIPGGRDAAADAARQAAEEGGRRYAGHVYDPFFFEGTKTYVYEVFEQLGRLPARLLFPLGNGTLLIGAVLALEELRSAGAIPALPEIVAYQAANCAPIARAAAAGAKEPEPVTPEATLAEGIAVGRPMRGAQVLEHIRRLGIRVFTVPEDRILEARAALAARGLYVEHTTAANLAAYWAYTQKSGPAPDTLIPLCGAGLKSGASG